MLLSKMCVCIRLGVWHKIHCVANSADNMRVQSHPTCRGAVESGEKSGARVIVEYSLVTGRQVVKVESEAWGHAIMPPTIGAHTKIS